MLEVDVLVVLVVLVQLVAHFELLFGTFEDVLHHLLVRFQFDVSDLEQIHVGVFEVEVGAFDFLVYHVQVALCEEGLLQCTQVVDEFRPRLEEGLEHLGN